MFWKKFSKHKPKETGWYLCTVKTCVGTRAVMELYWDSAAEIFFDERRATVFTMYDVFDYNYRTFQRSERIHKDDRCVWTDRVIAWKSLPAPCYLFGLKKGK